MTFLSSPENQVWSMRNTGITGLNASHPAGFWSFRCIHSNWANRRLFICFATVLSQTEWVTTQKSEVMPTRQLLVVSKSRSNIIVFSTVVWRWETCGLWQHCAELKQDLTWLYHRVKQDTKVFYIYTYIYISHHINENISCARFFMRFLNELLKCALFINLVYQNN